MCFTVRFGKFLRIPFFYRTPPVAASIFSEGMEKDHWLEIVVVVVVIFIYSWI